MRFIERHIVGFGILVTSVISVLPQPATANVVTTFDVDFSLNCISSCPQSATGSFTFDSTADTILSAAIQTPGPDSGISLNVDPPLYTTGTVIDFGTSYLFEFFNGGYSVLNFYTSNPLSLTSPNPVSIVSDNLEHYAVVGPLWWGRGGTGSISAAPLPPALPLFVSGLVGLGWLGGRRRRPRQASPTPINASHNSAPTHPNSLSAGSIIDLGTSARPFRSQKRRSRPCPTSLSSATTSA
jgi:hypothetical protein